MNTSRTDENALTEEDDDIRVLETTPTTAHFRPPLQPYAQPQYPSSSTGYGGSYFQPNSGYQSGQTYQNGGDSYLNCPSFGGGGFTQSFTPNYGAHYGQQQLPPSRSYQAGGIPNDNLHTVIDDPERGRMWVPQSSIGASSGGQYFGNNNAYLNSGPTHSSSVNATFNPYPNAQASGFYQSGSGYLSSDPGRQRISDYGESFAFPNTFQSASPMGEPFQTQSIPPVRTKAPELVDLSSDEGENEPTKPKETEEKTKSKVDSSKTKAVTDKVDKISKNRKRKNGRENEPMPSPIRPRSRSPSESPEKTSNRKKSKKSSKNKDKKPETEIETPKIETPKVKSTKSKSKTRFSRNVEEEKEKPPKVISSKKSEHKEKKTPKTKNNNDVQDVLVGQQNEKKTSKTKIKSNVQDVGKQNDVTPVVTTRKRSRRSYRSASPDADECAPSTDPAPGPSAALTRRSKRQKVAPVELEPETESEPEESPEKTPTPIPPPSIDMKNVEFPKKFSKLVRKRLRRRFADGDAQLIACCLCPDLFGKDAESDMKEHVFGHLRADIEGPENSQTVPRDAKSLNAYLKEKEPELMDVLKKTFPNEKKQENEEQTNKKKKEKKKKKKKGTDEQDTSHSEPIRVITPNSASTAVSVVAPGTPNNISSPPKKEPTRYLKLLNDLVRSLSKYPVIDCQYRKCTTTIRNGGLCSIERHVWTHYSKPTFQCLVCKNKMKYIVDHWRTKHAETMGETPQIRDLRADDEDTMIDLLDTCYPERKYPRMSSDGKTRNNDQEGSTDGPLSAKASLERVLKNAEAPKLPEKFLDTVEDMAKRHNGKFPLTCQHGGCEKQFTKAWTLDDFENHFLEHYAQKVFKCLFCDSMLVVGIEKHMEEVHPKEYALFSESEDYEEYREQGVILYKDLRVRYEKDLLKTTDKCFPKTEEEKRRLSVDRERKRLSSNLGAGPVNGNKISYTDRNRTTEEKVEDYPVPFNLISLLGLVKACCVEGKNGAIECMFDDCEEILENPTFTDIESHVVQSHYRPHLAKCLGCYDTFPTLKLTSRHVCAKTKIADLRSQQEAKLMEVVKRCFPEKDLPKEPVEYLRLLREALIRMKNRPIKCCMRGCGKMFDYTDEPRTIASLEDHVIYHIGSLDNYQCLICWKKFSCPNENQKHFKKDHDTDDVPANIMTDLRRYYDSELLHGLQDCFPVDRIPTPSSATPGKGWAKKTKSELKSGFLSLDGSSKWPQALLDVIQRASSGMLSCQYPKCSFLVSAKVSTICDVENHILSIHFKRRLFKCDLCYKSFVLPKGLQNHFAKEHITEKMCAEMIQDSRVDYEPTLINILNTCFPNQNPSAVLAFYEDEDEEGMEASNSSCSNYSSRFEGETPTPSKESLPSSLPVLPSSSSENNANSPTGALVAPPGALVATSGALVATPDALPPPNLYHTAQSFSSTNSAAVKKMQQLHTTSAESDGIEREQDEEDVDVEEMDDVVNSKLADPDYNDGDDSDASWSPKTKPPLKITIKRISPKKINIAEEPVPEDPTSGKKAKTSEEKRGDTQEGGDEADISVGGPPDLGPSQNSLLNQCHPISESKSDPPQSTTKTFPQNQNDQSGSPMKSGHETVESGDANKSRRSLTDSRIAEKGMDVWDELEAIASKEFSKWMDKPFDHLDEEQVAENGDAGDALAEENVQVVNENDAADGEIGNSADVDDDELEKVTVDDEVNENDIQSSKSDQYKSKTSQVNPGEEEKKQDDEEPSADSEGKEADSSGEEESNSNSTEDHDAEENKQKDPSLDSNSVETKSPVRVQQPSESSSEIRENDVENRQSAGKDNWDPLLETLIGNTAQREERKSVGNESDNMEEAQAENEKDNFEPVIQVQVEDEGHDSTPFNEVVDVENLDENELEDGDIQVDDSEEGLKSSVQDEKSKDECEGEVPTETPKESSATQATKDDQVTAESHENSQSQQLEPTAQTSPMLSPVTVEEGSSTSVAGNSEEQYMGPKEKFDCEIPVVVSATDIVADNAPAEKTVTDDSGCQKAREFEIATEPMNSTSTLHLVIDEDYDTEIVADGSSTASVDEMDVSDMDSSSHGNFPFPEPLMNSSRMDDFLDVFPPPPPKINKSHISPDGTDRKQDAVVDVESHPDKVAGVNEQNTEMVGDNDQKAEMAGVIDVDQKAEMADVTDQNAEIADYKDQNAEMADVNDQNAEMADDNDQNTEMADVVNVNDQNIEEPDIDVAAENEAVLATASQGPATIEHSGLAQEDDPSVGDKSETCTALEQSSPLLADLIERSPISDPSVASFSKTEENPCVSVLRFKVHSTKLQPRLSPPASIFRSVLTDDEDRPKPGRCYWPSDSLLDDQNMDAAEPEVEADPSPDEDIVEPDGEVIETEQKIQVESAEQGSKPLVIATTTNDMKEEVLFGLTNVRHVLSKSYQEEASSTANSNLMTKLSVSLPSTLDCDANVTLEFLATESMEPSTSVEKHEIVSENCEDSEKTFTAEELVTESSEVESGFEQLTINVANPGVSVGVENQSVNDPSPGDSGIESPTQPIMVPAGTDNVMTKAFYGPEIEEEDSKGSPIKFDLGSSVGVDSSINGVDINIIENDINMHEFWRSGTPTGNGEETGVIGDGVWNSVFS